jgi:hypothetical protein
MFKEEAMSQFKAHFGICVEGTRKDTKYSSKDGPSPGQSLNCTQLGVTAVIDLLFI